jgi:hypothetical protein
VGAEDLPGPLCHSVDNCEITHFNKSLFARMLEREWAPIEIKFQARMPRIFKDVLGSVFQEKIFIV